MLRDNVHISIEIAQRWLTVILLDYSQPIDFGVECKSAHISNKIQMESTYRHWSEAYYVFSSDLLLWSMLDPDVDV